MPTPPSTPVSSPKLQTTWRTLTSPSAVPRLPRADFAVYEARPERDQDIVGGIVVVQEIFGVNPHIRSVAERYAQRGYHVMAPAYFDHLEQGVELRYDTADFTRGRDLVGQRGWKQAVEDTQLAAEALRRALPESAHKVAVIGFCWGGTVAWLMSTRASDVIDAAVAYYGRMIWEFREEQPRKPVLLHYGAHDPSIPMEQIEDVRLIHPQLPIHLYDAGHGFHCDARKDFSPDASRLADARTMGFLRGVF